MKGTTNPVKRLIKPMSFALLFVILGNLIVGCSPTPGTVIPDTGTGPAQPINEKSYTVHILDLDGNPVGGAAVALIYPGGKKSNVTENYGDATFYLPEDLNGKEVEIVVEKDNKTVRITTTISFGNQKVQFDTRPKVSPEPTETVKPAPTAAQIVNESPTPTTTPAATPEISSCDSIFTSVPVFRSSLTKGELTGKILKPNNCTVGVPPEDTLPVSGTLSSVPKDRFFWILGYATNNRYYPQCNDPDNGRCVSVSGDGRWSAKAWIGVKGCKEDAHLVLISVDQTGHAALLKMMKDWGANNNYPGLDANDLPSGTTEVAAIEIETKGELC